MSYDLIVVGGGPAGSTAALFAARRGLKTLLLEKERFPREKTCGDALGGKAVAVLRELGLLERLRLLPAVEVRRVLFGSPEHVEAEIDLARARRREFATGFVVRREVLDAFLFAEAGKSSVECRPGFEVLDLLREGGAVSGVRGRDQRTGEMLEFRSRIVLGADGARSVVARPPEPRRDDPEHWVAGVRAYYRGVAGVTDRIELHFVDEVLPGYLWIFPRDGGAANVGIGMLAGPMKRRRVNLARVLEGLTRMGHFAPRFAAAARLTPTRGWMLPLGSRRRPCSGAGFMLAGDAAGLVDPFTGEGMANAMRSARAAVAVAAAACAAGDASAASLARYDRRLWDELGPELRTSARLQRLARLRPLLNFTIRKAARSRAVADLIGAMIAEEVPRAALTNPLFYLRLLLR